MHPLRTWISDWIRHFLPTPQAVSFLALLIAGGFAIVKLSNILLPVFAAGVIAYLLEGLVKLGVREQLPRMVSVVIVYLLFLAFLLFTMLALLPGLYHQSSELLDQLPTWMSHAQLLFMQLPERYPDMVTHAQLQDVMFDIRQGLINYGHTMLTFSYTSLISLITVTVYFILVPLLVFFFLKDKQLLASWAAQYLPKERRLWSRVWQEVDDQIGNYIRGKAFEILLLFIASYLVFSLLGLNYALLLAVLMGLSVIIPYIGATLVTFPVLLVGFFQWGSGEQFNYLAIAYGIIQSVDGVILVPLLFSEVVNLHPIAIMVAILFFGELWGFWGVFFAIPLATLVKAILSAWPHINDTSLTEGKVF